MPVTPWIEIEKNHRQNREKIQKLQNQDPLGIPVSAKKKMVQEHNDDLENEGLIHGTPHGPPFH
jgi:hypothetical protein